MSTNVIPFRPIAAPAVSPHWADQSAANRLQCVYHLQKLAKDWGISITVHHPRQRSA